MTAFPTAAGPTASDTPALAALTESLREQYRDSVKYVLAYGSCLRSGDIYDGLLDLYLIVDSYSNAYGRGLRAIGNWLLPPNVFYAQQEHDGQVLRCKYALISSADFARANSQRSFESYFWGRFAQPIGIVWERDAQQRFELDAVLQQAVGSFLNATLPALPEQGSLEQLWSDGLSLSYNSELRSERSSRATELASTSRQHFESVTELAQIPSLQLNRDGDQLAYQSHYSALQRRWAKLAWPLRALSGKLRSILRLIKALFTFAGGLDYIAWKLERHSGQKVEIPNRVRRFPLIFVWGFCWQLYRRGIFK